MISGNDAADQVVRYTLEGTEILLKLTGVAAKNAATFLHAILKDSKKTRGKTTVTRMLREGKELQFFPVPTNQLKEFAKEAKRYGLLFVAMKHKGNKEAETDVMVFAQDAPKVNRIMDRLALAHIDPDSVKAEILQDQEQGDAVNFTELGRSSPFGSFSRSNSNMPALPSGAEDNWPALPAPEYPVIITEAPKERLGLPERTDGVIIQPPAPTRLALPAPAEERTSVRVELENIREQQLAKEKGRNRENRQPQQLAGRKRRKKKIKAKAR